MAFFINTLILFILIPLADLKLFRMTRLGEYLASKAVNRAEVARKTGLSTARLSELSSNENTHLRATELYLIALAIGVDPCEILHFVCKGVKLKLTQK